MEQRPTTAAALALLIALIPSVAVASDLGPPVTVVFDSTPDFAGGGAGFTSRIREIGESVALSGSARYVTQIDLLLEGFVGSTYVVRFYEIDNASDAPSNMIWESAPQTLGFVPGGRILSSVSVPKVLVPDSMAFSIVEHSPNSNIGIKTSNSASIGTNLGFWYRRPNGAAWIAGPFGDAAYNVKIFAVPEPDTAIGLSIFVTASLFARQNLRRSKSN